MKMKKKHIHLTEKQYSKLNRISVSDGIGVSEIIRRAIDLYLETQDAKQLRIATLSPITEVDKPSSATQT